MKKSVILLLSALLMNAVTFAATPSWEVRPNVCISKQIGEQCEMQIYLYTSDLPPGKYCLYLGARRQACYDELPRAFFLTIRFNQDEQLRLLDSKQHVILTHPLTVKARQASTARRRVRQPWSLF